LRSVSGISAIEVNISCPNVENRGLVFACDPEASKRVIDGVRRTIGGELPIIAKLSPDVTDLVSIAKGVVDAGADALALINTVLGMVINLDTMPTPWWKNGRSIRSCNQTNCSKSCLSSSR
jgi:dihydroorotate dehydrogenase (NAD+) catalytic subunit